MEKETWKLILGYENFYEVSSFGNVRAFDKYVPTKGGVLKMLRGRILRPGIVSGYPRVLLHKNKVRKNLFVHRLVAQAFISNPENKPCVNHINGNKIDNRAENLEWCTSKENLYHAKNTLGRNMFFKKGNTLGVKFAKKHIYRSHEVSI